MDRYAIGFTTYRDLKEGTAECFMQSLDQQYGQGYAVQWIMQHLHIVKDTSKEVDSQQVKECDTEPSASVEVADQEKT